jgi:hypothetical protein
MPQGHPHDAYGEPMGVYNYKLGRNAAIDPKDTFPGDYIQVTTLMPAQNWQAQSFFP